jgi:hypothetical protein
MSAWKSTGKMRVNLADYVAAPMATEATVSASWA